MHIIGARASDWRPARRDVKPALWIGGVIGALVFYVAVSAAIGHLIVGNGAPYLS